MITLTIQAIEKTNGDNNIIKIYTIFLVLNPYSQ